MLKTSLYSLGHTTTRNIGLCKIDLDREMVMNMCLEAAKKEKIKIINVFYKVLKVNYRSVNQIDKSYDRNYSYLP